MDQIRGRRRRGREQMEQTSRSDPLVALSVRAEKPAVKRHRDVGHGGGESRTNRRFGPR